MNRIGQTICAAAVLASTSAFAQSATAQTNDATSAAVAKISLSAAATAAEEHHKGKAVKAEYERQKDGRWVYDIEVRAGASVFDVKVDPDKGTVIASTEDKLDADDDGDAAD
jgi:uncharacterized membrane protein YkoI